MNTDTGARPTFNEVRACKDREYAADVLLTIARRRAKYVKTVMANDRDDICVIVVMSLMKDWEAGVPLGDLVKWIDARLYRRGVDFGRREDRGPSFTLDAPIGPEGESTLIDSLADPKATVEERVIAKERIEELKPELEKLERYLSRAHPRVRLIHEMALAGVDRTQISRTLDTQHGITASANVVAQVLTRDLRNRFPNLASLWTGHA